MRKTPTPTPYSSGNSRSTSPTPNSILRKKKKSFFYPVDQFLIKVSNHKILFPAILILSILLSTLIINITPSFCASDGSHTSFRCKRCPDNSRCGSISFECEKGFYKINNNCVSKDQMDRYTTDISYLASNISFLLQNKKVTNLNDIAANLNEPSLQIRTAIEYTDYRIIEDDTIEKIFNNPSEIGYIFFTSLSYLISLFGVLILGYHFLRDKNI